MIPVITSAEMAEMRRVAWESDAAFIAMARTALPRVLDALEASQDALTKAKQELAAERARSAEMREALMPFADDFYHKNRLDSELVTVNNYNIGDFRRAARVLAQPAHDDEVRS